VNIKLKWVVVFEAVAILILLAALVYVYSGTKTKKVYTQEALLSPNVYSGAIEPKSFLIVDFSPLKEKINNYITKNNLNVSVYVENFRNGAYMGINEKVGFFPASLSKLPIAIVIMRNIESGTLSYSTMLQIRDDDRTASSGELYKTAEKELPLQVVLEKMLKESDNTALRIMLHYVDLEDFQFLLDYYNLDINADLQKEQRDNHPDFVSPKSISNIFSSLYFSSVLEPQNSQYLLSLLRDTTFDINKAAGLPDNITIVHKFGKNYYNANKYFHDCGILYYEDSRIFYCIMTKNEDENEAPETVGVIVNEIYHYVRDTRAKMEAYKR